ncbi:hypothetical protein EVAR_90566_1 [Eumeta japonica]|uniref:Uncharacterized protein n=1 Tax=Eumeta variegata TaxID=151549 RepID=A0A4C1YWD7_EUMVA|nr:hypothetical protein EVAR_90566_1 [Eumeta japonica]
MCGLYEKKVRPAITAGTGPPRRTRSWAPMENRAPLSVILRCCCKGLGLRPYWRNPTNRKRRKRWISGTTSDQTEHQAKGNETSRVIESRNSRNSRRRRGRVSRGDARARGLKPELPTQSYTKTSRHQYEFEFSLKIGPILRNDNIMPMGLLYDKCTANTKSDLIIRYQEKIIPKGCTGAVARVERPLRRAHPVPTLTPSRSLSVSDEQPLFCILTTIKIRSYGVTEWRLCWAGGGQSCRGAARGWPCVLE